MKKTLLALLITIHSCFAFQQIQELPDPSADTLANWTGIKKGLYSSFVSTDTRYARSLVPNVNVQKTASLTAWKGETVSAQVLLWTSQEIGDVNLIFSDFQRKDGSKIPSSIANARFVTYVMTDHFGPGCGYRKPADFPSSLSPDMLSNSKTYRLQAQQTRPVWLTLSVPADAISGEYVSTITIKGKGTKTQTLNVHLEVIGQTLPPSKEWGFHLDNWQHPTAIARTEGLEIWSDAHFTAMKPLMQMLARLGQKVITTNVNKDPWNNQCYDAYADMITWTKQKDGNWKYDYVAFDKWVQFMMDLGINKQINAYSLLPWNNEIHYMDESTGKLVNVSAEPGTSLFTELWTPFLKDFTAHLRSKKWLEITTIAMDERKPEIMQAAVKLLNEVAPELGIALADNQKSYKRYPNITDISVEAGAKVDHEDIISRRNAGLVTTYYVCCSDAFPNRFTFSDPAESTYIGWYTLANDFDGFLHWAYNSWVENPIQDSRFRTWPAGDTYLVYPHGQSSIRYERMLEGIQDYEKVQIIRKKLKTAGHAALLEKLENAIAKLSSNVRTPEWNSNLNEAKKMLLEASKVVQI